MILYTYRREDKIWALEEATKPIGFIPHARSSVDLLTSLEGEGLVWCTANGCLWFITDKGREWLKNAKWEDAKWSKDSYKEIKE